MLTALAFGGGEPVTTDEVFVYRNIFDLREPIMAGRMSETRAEPSLSTGKLIGDHGSPPWSTLTLFHNTVIAGGSRDALMASGSGATPERPKRVFHNIFFHTDRLPAYLMRPEGTHLTSDGNLFWSPTVDEKTVAGFFKKWRASPAFEANKKLYEPGSEANSLVTDPKLMNVSPKVAHSGYALAADSPAINAGAPVQVDPGDEDAAADEGKPDIGAIPAGGKMFSVGRQQP